MAVEYGWTTGRERGSQPWQVCVRDTEGDVLCAGILVGGGHVLTCAHAIGRSDAQVMVDCEPTGPMIMATVPPDCWVPLADGRGDMALLELAHRLPEGSGAPLRRLPPTRNRRVHTFGYPDDHPNGVRAMARLAGAHRPGDEWIRLNWTEPDTRVCHGFGGAAVVDELTGDVIGMVVGRYSAGPADGAWMLPLETVIGRIPRVAGRVSGAPATDRAFVQGLGSQLQNEDLARILTDWLARPELGNNVDGTNKVVVQARDIHVNGNFVIVVTGDYDSASSEALRRAVVLSDRELRATSTADVAKAPEGTVPPVGSIDVAIDASGRSDVEVFRLIADRMGIPVDEAEAPGEALRGGPAPMTVVLDGVDDAIDPEALLELVKVLPDLGCRVVLGFRRRSSAAVSSARSLLSSPDPGSVAERLDRLPARLIELGTAERELRELAERVSMPVPDAPDRAVSLRTRLTGLRLAARAGQEIETALESAERAVDRALTKVRELRRDFDEQLARRNELRGRLTGYKAMAETKGLVEDLTLAALFRLAHEALWRAPCDVPAAAALVDDYVHAVRRKLGTEAAP